MDAYVAKVFLNVIGDDPLDHFHAQNEWNQVDERIHVHMDVNPAFIFHIEIYRNETNKMKEEGGKERDK